MKKMNKVPALIGAVAMLLVTVISLISSLTTLSVNIQYGNWYYLIVSVFLLTATRVAFAVGLFRGKKDVLGAILIGSGALVYLLYTVRAFSISNLLALAVFVLLLLSCLEVLKLPKPLGSLIIIVPAAILLPSVLGSFFKSLLIDGHGDFSTKMLYYNFGLVIRIVLTNVLLTAAQILAAIAVTSEPKVKSLPQYQQTQYQQTQYQAPYQQYQQPQYQQPQYQQYQQPQYQQYQQYQQPQYQQAPYGQQPQYQGYPKDPKNFGYISMATHVLLSLFTFGIWTYIWIYKTTKTLSSVPGEQPQDPTVKLLLCMFVPFYMFFWLYNQGKRAEAYGRSAGVQVECATLCLVFAFLFPLASYILLQSGINRAAEAMAR